jgi:radical SAM protein with 4Fe4S-binding SPASM domain
MCRTTNILINPSGDIYRCQRDLLLAENPIGNILDPNLKIGYDFRECSNYGQCHPCDVKVKTNSKQQLGTTLVEIKDVKPKA